jgi:hypothetical protein
MRVFIKSITYDPPLISQRVRRAAQKFAFRDAGEYWHHFLRPKHFTRRAFAEYDYEPRSAAYEYRKSRRKGHRNPLVFSGESRDRSRRKKITVTYKGAKVRMSIPAFNFLNQWQTRTVTGREEFERFSTRDESLLINRFAVALDKGFEQQGKAATVQKITLGSSAAL